MVTRYDPPVINDEAEFPEYVNMHHRVDGDYVAYQDYETLQQELKLLRSNARRMIEAVKNLCADMVEEKKEDPGEDGVLYTLDSLERAMRAIDVDFELFKPRG